VQLVRGFLGSFSCVLGAALALSCGGSQSSTLFMGPDAAADDGGPPDSASPPDARAVDAPSDVITPIADSAGPARDATPLDGSDVDARVPPYSVACGTTTCEAPGQFCCLSGLPATATYACESDSTSCGGNADAKIYCTSSTQCATGQVCCGHVLPPAVVTCQPTCTAANDYVFCDPSAPTDCPQGHKCVPSTRIVGYDRCN
jgi:hypothetical protein